MTKTIQSKEREAVEKTVEIIDETLDVLRILGEFDVEATECLVKKADCLLKVYETLKN